MLLLIDLTPYYYEYGKQNTQKMFYCRDFMQITIKDFMQIIIDISCKDSVIYKNGCKTRNLYKDKLPLYDYLCI